MSYYFSGSLSHLLAMVGGLTNGHMLVWFGQRKITIAVLPLSLISWLGHTYAPNAWFLKASRALLGFCQGMYFYCAYTFAAEITHPNYRSILCGMIDCFIQLGFLFVFTIGSTGLHWRTVATICGFSSTVVPFIIFIFLHDSPRWLISKNKYDDAKQALIFYRGDQYDVETELKHITDQLTSQSGFMTQLKAINDKSILKRLLILGYFTISEKFTGNMILVTFAAIIFKSVNPSGNENTSTIMIGLVKVASVFIYAYLSTRIGRKIFITIPLLGCGLFMLGLSAFTYFEETGSDITAINWLPIVLIMMFISFTCLGTPAINLYRSEILPNNVRNVALSYLSVIHYLSQFLILYYFNTMTYHIRFYGCFALFGVNCLIMSIVAQIVLPETKGKSLEEIDDYFRGIHH